MTVRFILCTTCSSILLCNPNPSTTPQQAAVQATFLASGCEGHGRANPRCWGELRPWCLGRHQPLHSLSSLNAGTGTGVVRTAQGRVKGSTYGQHRQLLHPPHCVHHRPLHATALERAEGCTTRRCRVWRMVTQHCGDAPSWCPDATPAEYSKPASRLRQRPRTGHCHHPVVNGRHRACTVRPRGRRGGGHGVQRAAQHCRLLGPAPHAPQTRHCRRRAAGTRRLVIHGALSTTSLSVGDGVLFAWSGHSCGRPAGPLQA
jgi:hypothetical protein